MQNDLTETIKKAKATAEYHEKEARRWHDFITMAQSLHQKNGHAVMNGALSVSATTKSGKAIEIAQELYRQRHEPIPSKDILEKLEEIGVDVPGENKTVTVSSYLSKSEEMKAEGRKGWVPVV